MNRKAIAVAIGVVILTFFAIWERRLENGGGTPIVSMRLFRNRQFVSGASVVGVLMLAQNGVIFTLPVFLQSVKRLDAFHTGLTLLPMSLMLLIVSPAAAGLTKRIAHKRLVQTGLVINTIAIISPPWRGNRACAKTPAGAARRPRRSSAEDDRSPRA